MRALRWFIILLAGMLALAACQSSAALTLPGEAALEAVAPVLHSQPTISPTSEAVAAAAAEPNYCLDCHADQQQLIDTAKPLEPAGESESSGVG